MALLQRLSLGSIRPASETLGNSFDVTEQRLRVEWLTQKCKTALIHGLSFQRAIGESGNDDHRWAEPQVRLEHSQKLQAAALWHLDICDDHVASLSVTRRDELFGAIEGKGRKSGLVQQVHQGCPHGRVIIDHGDDELG